MARDTHGNTVHIFERECSIQRRNQKLIEQTPSPVVDQETRDRIGELVVKAPKAVDYTNLGTAEFLRTDDSDFFFIETIEVSCLNHIKTSPIVKEDV